MSKKQPSGSGRVSFAGLKNQRVYERANQPILSCYSNANNQDINYAQMYEQSNNKENNVSFENISKIYKNSHNQNLQTQSFSSHERHHIKLKQYNNAVSKVKELGCSSSSSRFAQIIRNKCQQQSQIHIPIKNSHSIICKPLTEAPSPSPSSSSSVGLYPYSPSALSSINAIYRNASNTDMSINLSILEAEFQQGQQEIHASIQACNTKYSQICEMLADIHIQDVMRLNALLVKNQETYNTLLRQYNMRMQVTLRGDAHYCQDIQCIHSPFFNQVKLEDFTPLLQIERAILRTGMLKNRSCDFRSTCSSKNKIKGKNSSQVSSQSSKLSPGLIKQKVSQLHQQKYSPPQAVVQYSANMQQLMESTEREEQKGQRHSVNGYDDSFGKPNRKTEGQNSNKSEALQDTPQSIKSKISQTSRVRVQKDPAIGMFDRINICESVQEIDVNKDQNNKQSRPTQNSRAAIANFKSIVEEVKKPTQRSPHRYHRYDKSTE